MDLAQVETWVRQLEPLGQADTPFDIKGVVMTPRGLLQHAQANDAIWQQVK